MNYPWIAQQRQAAFASELSDNTIWVNVAAMMLSEGSPQQSLESMFNRIMYCRANGKSMSIMDMIKSGFYGPYNRGEYPSFILQVRQSQAIVNQMDAAVNAVMAGSDTITGYTDQGLPTDPNGSHQPQIHIGGNIFNDWGGGPGGHAGAAAWRTKFESMKETKVADPTPTPAPAPAPAPAPVPPAPAIDPYAPILAMLKAAGKLSPPTINITVNGEVTLIVNGKQVLP